MKPTILALTLALMPFAAYATPMRDYPEAGITPKTGGLDLNVQGQFQNQGQNQGQESFNNNSQRTNSRNTNVSGSSSGSESNAVSGSDAFSGSTSSSNSSSGVANDVINSTDASSSNSLGVDTGLNSTNAVDGLSNAFSYQQEGDLLLYLPDPVPINLPAITDSSAAYTCGGSGINFSYVGGESTGVTLWVFGVQHQKLGDSIPDALQTAVKLMDFCQTMNLVEATRLPDSRKEAIHDILTLKILELFDVKPSQVTLQELQ